eukprot:Polyplicarium_translucidae@DN3370_c0_g1_i3.p1
MVMEALQSTRGKSRPTGACGSAGVMLDVRDHVSVTMRNEEFPFTSGRIDDRPPREAERPEGRPVGVPLITFEPCSEVRRSLLGLRDRGCALFAPARTASATKLANRRISMPLAFFLSAPVPCSVFALRFEFRVQSGRAGRKEESSTDRRSCFGSIAPISFPFAEAEPNRAEWDSLSQDWEEVLRQADGSDFALPSARMQH